MCEATVYIRKNDNNEEIMKEVEFAEENQGLIKVIDIMGKELIINGRIIKVDLVKNQIFVSE